MSEVNANIHIVVDSQQALSQIRSLQNTINTFNKSVASSNSAALAQQRALNNALMDGAAVSRMFKASIVPTTMEVDRLSSAIDKSKLSLGEYTRYAGSQLPGLRRVFTREFDLMTKVAEDRVKRLQTQYTALGDSSKALGLKPLALDMDQVAAKTAIAAQRQMLFNKMIDDGSTKLLNWGKNTQWAGRQLMVGFSMPLALFGATAAKIFMDLDKQARDFKRVYGDAFTTPAEIEGNLKAVQKLGKEYTKYGVTVEDTMKVAATAAAAGMRNEELLAGTEESLRLATIGQIDYNQALDTTISLQTAFQMSNEELAPTVDFLGAVANQTVLTIDDMTKAIPRVAPVIQGLGGDVRDLAALLVAMREGGVSAENAANALKSGLASLINPTKNAQKALAGLGIDINAIVQSNKGDLMGTINDFAAALSKLGEFERQQALEKTFGKYQYARLGALFDNIIAKGGQAAVALDLAGKSAEELGQISAKSLNEIEESTTAKFQGAVERLKVAIAPVGEAFLKALTPIINLVTKIADKFNELPDNVKNVIAVVTGIIAGLGPVILMGVGLIANGFANLIKFMQFMRKGFARLKGDASAFQYLGNEQLDAAAASATLEGKTTSLTNSLLLQQRAVAVLIGLYSRLAQSASVAAANMPALMGFGGQTQRPPARMAKGGIVPGSGSGDKIPALLEPGESVVTKDATQKYAPVIAAMNAGTLPGFMGGYTPQSIIDAIGTENIRSNSGNKITELLTNILQNSDNTETQIQQAVDQLKEAAKDGKVSAKQLEEIAKTLELKTKAPKPPESDEGTVGAHLTTRGKTGVRTAAGDAFVASRPELQRVLQENPQLYDFYSERSGLTGEVRRSTNLALNAEKGTGAGVSSQEFSQEFKGRGAVLGPSLIQYGGLSTEGLQDPTKLGGAVAALERQIANRAAWIAKTNDGLVVDEILAQATEDVISAREKQALTISESTSDEAKARQAVTAAARKAKDTVAQVVVDLSGPDGEKYIKANPDLFTTKTTDKEISTRAGVGRLPDKSPDPDKPGIVVRRESLRSKSIRPERVGGTARWAGIGKDRTAQLAEMGIQQAKIVSDAYVSQVEKSTSDIYPLSRDRGSPHPLVAKDARDDAIQYRTVAQRELSKVPASVTRGGVLLGGPQSPTGISAAGQVPSAASVTALAGARGEVAALLVAEAAALDNLIDQTESLGDEREQDISEVQTEAAVSEVSPLQKQRDRFNEQLNTTKNAISQVFIQTESSFSNLFNSVIKPTIQNIKQSFIEMKNIMMKTIKDISAPYTRAAKFVFDTIKLNFGIAAELSRRFIVQTFEQIKGFITTKFNNAVAFASAKIASVANKFQSAYTTILTQTIAAIDYIKTLPNIIQNKVQQVQAQLNALATNVVNNVRTTANNLMQASKQVATNIRDRAAQVLSTLKDKAIGLGRGAVTAGTIAMNPVPRAIATATVGKTIADKSTLLFNTALEKATNYLNIASMKINEFSNKIITAATDLSKRVVAIAIDLSNQVKQKISLALTTIQQTTSMVANQIKTTAIQLSNEVVKAYQRVSSFVSTAATIMSSPVSRAIVLATILDKTVNPAVARVGQSLNTLKQSVVNAATLISRGAQLMADPLGRAVVLSMIAKPINNAAKFIYDTVKLNFGVATELSRRFIIDSFNTTKQIIIRSGIELQKAFQTAKTFIQKSPAMLKDAFIRSKDFIYQTIKLNTGVALELGRRYIVDAFNRTKEIVINASLQVKEAFNVAKLKLISTFNTIREPIQKEFMRIKEILQRGAIDLTSSIKALSTSVKASVNEFATKARSAIVEMGPKIKTAAAEAGRLVVEAGKLLAVSIQSAAQGVRGWLNQTNDMGVTRGQRIARGANIGMGGLMGVSMMGSMMEGPMGELSRSIMPVTTALFGLQMILPMLTNPIGLLTLAVTGAVAGFIYLRKQLDDTAKEAAKLGSNIGGVANGMDIIEQATGFAAPTRNEQMFRFSKEDKQAMLEFSSFFESESGKKFLDELKSATSEERYTKVAHLLAQGVGAGLDPEKAKTFGYAIADATGDALLKSSIARDFAAGMFKSGSDALITLEKERLKLAPNVKNIRPDYSGATAIPFDSPGSPMEAALRGGSEYAIPAAAGAAIVGGALAAPTGGISVGAAAGVTAAAFAIGAARSYVIAMQEQNRVTEEAAKALGFSLQTAKNLSIAEATLAQDRANGLISVKEYNDQQKELNSLQEEQNDYIGSILKVGADAGALQQALGDQLLLGGFNQDQIGKITETFNADALAQQFFGKDTYAELGKEQQDYINTALSELLTGLTPENAAQRLEDLQTTWTDLANRVVQAMVAGGENVDVPAAIQQESFADWFASEFSDEIGSIVTNPFQAEAAPKLMAENLQSQDAALKEMGSSAMQVQSLLQSFQNKKLVIDIAMDPDEILKVGEFLTKLKDYPDINIELMMQNDIDPDDVLKTLKEIEGLKFDKDGSFKDINKLLPDRQAFTNYAVSIGKDINQIPGFYADAVNQADQILDGFSKDSFNKLGNIKPKIIPDIIPRIFGNDVNDPAGLASSLQSAFPEGLDPLTLSILISLGGDPLALAILKNPAALKAAQEGKTSFTDKVYTPGVGEVEVQRSIDPELVNQLKGTGNAGGNGFGDDTTGGGGGAEDGMKSLQDSLLETLRMYTNFEKIMKQVADKKMSFEKALKSLSYGGIIAELRRMNLSEGLISEIISKGADAAKKIAEGLKKKGAAFKQNQLYLKGQVGKIISDNVGGIRDSRQQFMAVQKLQGEGLTDEQIQSLTEDPVKSAAINSIDKGSEAWIRLMRSTKNASKAAEQYQAAVDPVGYAVEQFEKSREPQLAQFDFLESQFEYQFFQIDKKYKTMVKNKETTIKQLQRQIAAINKQIAGLEALNNADEMRIRSLTRQKEMIQRQIEALERQNELDQRRIDGLRREDEIRNRVADALSHELDIMSQQEDKMREAHDKRVKALESVTRLNDRIIQQQRSQLSIAQALSQGDIFAATAAAQDMEAQQVQFAQEQTRLSLDQGLENAIGGLRTEGGLTRSAAEQQINDIKQQSYQTSLQIRDIEDQIYNRNLQTVPLKDQIYQLDMQIRGISDIIFDRETQILNIRNGQLAPLQAQLDAEEESLSNLNEQWENEKASLMIQGLTYEQLQEKIEAEKLAARLVISGIKVNGEMRRSVENLRKKWLDVTEQIAAAVRTAKELSVQAQRAAQSDFENINLSVESGAITAAEGNTASASRAAALAARIAQIEAERDAAISAAIQSGTAAISNGMGMNAGGYIRKYARGSLVSGPGARDSVPAILAPGEFVIRRAMVDKYGIPMLNKLNMGSFPDARIPERTIPRPPKFKIPERTIPRFPRFNIPEGSRNQLDSIIRQRDMERFGSDLYNTNNSVNVFVSGDNLSPDQIANRTIAKLKELDSMRIRGNRAK